ncbi:MAG TPA: TetR family transcriptional regulator, partial [Acidimicrobiia bacterium]|nr:TetR family transcriptional regulator [Acidimicrobiia bacterium]
MTTRRDAKADARASRRRAGVTKERIVDEALGIVERDGVDQLSMRKLAAQLGVQPTSIYWHVGGREQ